MSGLAEDQARAVLETIQAEWNAAMSTWDAAAVAELYDPSAQLFGSSGTLFSGQSGACDYYSSFATAQSCAAIFDNRSVTSPAAAVVVASGFVTFAMQISGEARTAEFRFTFVLRQAERWLILAHHASPVPTSSPAD